MTYRMIYLRPHDPNRPRSIAVAGRTAHEAVLLAERIATLAGWLLLTVTRRT